MSRYTMYTIILILVLTLTSDIHVIPVRPEIKTLIYEEKSIVMHYDSFYHSDSVKCNLNSINNE